MCSCRPLLMKRFAVNMKLLKPLDVKNIIGISLTNTYKLFELKDFPSFRIGHRWFVKEKDLEAFFDEYKSSKIYLGNKTGVKTGVTFSG